MNNNVLYFCGECKKKISVGGWGGRTYCPHCEKDVYFTKEYPKQIVKKKKRIK